MTGGLRLSWMKRGPDDKAMPPDEVLFFNRRQPSSLQQKTKAPRPASRPPDSCLAADQEERSPSGQPGTSTTTFSDLPDGVVQRIAEFVVGADAGRIKAFAVREAILLSAVSTDVRARLAVRVVAMLDPPTAFERLIKAHAAGQRGLPSREELAAACREAGLGAAGDWDMLREALRVAQDDRLHGCGMTRRTCQAARRVRDSHDASEQRHSRRLALIAAFRARGVKPRPTSDLCHSYVQGYAVRTLEETVDEEEEEAFFKRETTLRQLVEDAKEGVYESWGSACGFGCPCCEEDGYEVEDYLAENLEDMVEECKDEALAAWVAAKPLASPGEQLPRRLAKRITALRDRLVGLD